MKTVLVVLLGALAWPAFGSEGQPEIHRVDLDVFDQASVRRGAEHYIHYCQGCHSLKHLRYSRLAQDYQIDEATMKNEFLLGERKMHETLLSAMRPADAEQWFGAPAPDLSLSARARGADWIYTYLKSFYLDPSRPSGVNNLLVSNVAMPNVLADFQGLQAPVIAHQEGVEYIEKLELVQPGSMSLEAFDRALHDLMNFLVYVSEPSQLQRLKLGKYVLAFLLLLTVLLYLLKKEFWKDVH